MASGTGCYDLLCLGVLNNVVVVLPGGGVDLRVLAGFHCCVVGAWTWWLDRIVVLRIMVGLWWSGWLVGLACLGGWLDRV